MYLRNPFYTRIGDYRGYKQRYILVMYLLVWIHAWVSVLNNVIEILTLGLLSLEIDIDILGLILIKKSEYYIRSKKGVK